MAEATTQPTAPAITPAVLEKHRSLIKQAQRLVGQTFYGTLLKQMHDSPFKSDIFSGGRGGEAFSPMFDQQMIDRMSASPNGGGGKLVKSVVRSVEGAARYRALEQQAKAAQTPSRNSNFQLAR